VPRFPNDRRTPRGTGQIINDHGDRLTMLMVLGLRPRLATVLLWFARLWPERMLQRVSSSILCCSYDVEESPRVVVTGMKGLRQDVAA